MLRVLAPMLKRVLQQIRLQGFFYAGRKTRNIAIQLVMQQCCKISYTFLFFLPVLPYLTETSDGVELILYDFFFQLGYTRASY